MKRFILLVILMACHAVALADDVRVVNLAARDIVYDPGTRRIYATVPGSGGTRANTVTAIDPVTGVAGSSVFVGSDPAKMALADGGKGLWIALDGSGALRRFDLATQSVGPQYPLGGGLFAEDIAAVPGAPDAVAVARMGKGGSPRHADITVYDNGKPRPKTATPGNSIAFSAFGPRLYAYNNELSSYDLCTVAIGSGGLERLSYTGGVIQGNATIQAANGLIYTSSGRVIDPESRQQIGQFPAIGYGGVCAPDPAAGRVFYVMDGKLHAFDSRTFGEVGTIALPGLRGGVYRLIRWGADGLAFNTTEGQVFLIRTALVGARRPPVDLEIARTPLPRILRAGAQASYTLTVRNRGSTAATGVMVTDDLTKDLDVVNIKASAGSATAAEGVVRAELGDLAPDGKATIDVTVSPKAEGAFAPVAIVRCDQIDLNAANNVATQRTELAAQPGSPASGIDLTGSWVSAGQTVKGAGAELQATLEGVFLVKNIGTAPAPATVLRFYLSYTIGPFLEEDLIQELQVPALGPGKSFEAHLKAKLFQGDSAVGDVLTAMVDATKLVAESNKENNRVHSKPIP